MQQWGSQKADKSNTSAVRASGIGFIYFRQLSNLLPRSAVDPAGKAALC